MKATGIVRRIDDLGRVVIPKEIRRTMRIRKGYPLEIYTDREGEVIFKKYSPIGELGEFASQYAETMHKTCDIAIVITDRDTVIAASGVPKKEFIDKAISPDLEKIIESRSLYRYRIGDKKIYATDDTSDGKNFISCALPIVTEGDIIGCVVSFCNEENAIKMNEELETKLVQTAASFLGKQLEN